MQAQKIRPACLRIGELAARTGRSIHTIRWYESQGLIPNVVRDSGGRRVYMEGHRNWLDLIHKLRLTGLSIAQLRQFTALVKQGKGTLRQQREILHAHRTNVKQSIAEWTVALRMLDHKIAYFDEWLETGRRPLQDNMPAAAKQLSKPNGRR